MKLCIYWPATVVRLRALATGNGPEFVQSPHVSSHAKEAIAPTSVSRGTSILIVGVQEREFREHMQAHRTYTE